MAYYGSFGLSERKEIKEKREKIFQRKHENRRLIKRRMVISNFHYKAANTIRAGS